MTQKSWISKEWTCVMCIWIYSMRLLTIDVYHKHSVMTFIIISIEVCYSIFLPSYNLVGKFRNSDNSKLILHRHIPDFPLLWRELCFGIFLFHSKTSFGNLTYFWRQIVSHTTDLLVDLMTPVPISISLLMSSYFLASFSSVSFFSLTTRARRPFKNMPSWEGFTCNRGQKTSQTRMELWQITWLRKFHMTREPAWLDFFLCGSSRKKKSSEENLCR